MLENTKVWRIEERYMGRMKKMIMLRGIDIYREDIVKTIYI